MERGEGILVMGKVRDILFGKKKEAPVSKYATTDDVSSSTAELRAELEVLNRRLSSVQNDNARERRTRQMGAVASVLKRAVPKGIKNPDEMIRNVDLYTGGPLNRTKVFKSKKRLF